MASKQRPFFDDRAQKPSYIRRRDNRPPIPKPQHPPRQPNIPISLQSRSKLGAFRYTPVAELMDENADQQLPRCAEEIFAKPRRSPEKNATNGKAGRAAQAVGHEYPTTPMGRVPLKDLFNEEGGSQKMLVCSPSDHVLWRESPTGSEEPCSLATPMAKRGKKRARSSSPVSSQKKEGMHKAPFDLQNLQSSLAGDPADPAVDLEKRYFSRARFETPNRLSASAAPDFMHSSSPHAPALSSGGSGKLRRTASCGIEWPERKRPRASKPDLRQQPEDKRPSSTPKSHAGPESIPAILDQIQPGLMGIQHGRGSLPSSAPQVARRSLHPSQPQSVWAASTHQSAEQSRRSSVTVVGENGNLKPPSSLTTPKNGSSEFDDDELDQSLLEAADTSIQVDGAACPRICEGSQDPARLQQHITADQVPPEPQRHVAPDELDSRSEQARPMAIDGALVDGISSKLDGEDDEFADPDLYAADFEDLARTYDTQGAQSEERGTPVNDERGSGLPTVNGQPMEANTVESHGHETIAVEIPSDEEFEDGTDFDAVVQECERATQAINRSREEREKIAFHRFVIVTVTEGRYQDDRSRECSEKILLVKEEKTKSQKAVTLRQAWFDSPCKPDTIIHVVGDFDRAGQCVIDDAHNYLVLHPDHLISATVVADSFSCTRRAVLQDRVKATSSASEAQVYGHILHEVFQEALKANRWESEWFATLTAKACTRHLESLHEIRVETVEAVEHLMTKVPELQSWAALFVASQPKENAHVHDRNNASALMCVNKLLDVEEHVWSPTYGLKGNIDATIQVTMKDGQGEKTLTVPLELKTGKNNTSTSHKAQTALYTLLLSDRYDIAIAHGFLYYMETSETLRVSGIRHELLHMIKQRNILASYIRDHAELPPMLKDPRLCGKCYAQKACFTYHRLVEDGNGDSSGLKERFNQVVHHLTPQHQDFFRVWDDLLTKEEGDLLRFRRELWTMTSSEREKVGRCFADLTIVEGSAMELADSPKINRFKYSFKKRKGPYFSFTDSQITIGEPIVISDEKGHYALANGYVSGLSKSRITVAVDRRIHNSRVETRDFDEINHQSFVGIMQVESQGNARAMSGAPESGETVTYRLDKDEFSNGMATARNNVLRIMENDTVGAMSLRRLIVDGAAPSFEPLQAGTALKIPKSLNADQQNAIRKVMSAKDYALVLGMPGTGKTTTIAHIIRALTSIGKSVLLASYTHTAVDNILLKIRDGGMQILRLGAVAKVHPEVRSFVYLASEPKTSEEELKVSYASQVVATTCLGINHPIFNERMFDYCIVDEASQITLPVCLGPIRMAKIFVLVGDHFQLPPLVQNKQARQGGLDVSLFKSLCDRRPESVANLEHQYRMCEDIMSLSNALIYSGRLKCGTAEVASRALNIPDMSALKLHHHTPSTLAPGQKSFCAGPSYDGCWLRNVVDPARRVLFLNADPMRPSSLEIAKGARITNPIEVTVTVQVIEALLTIGVPASEIGIITLYRSQLALLRQTLRSQSSFVGGGTSDAGHGRAHAVEMHTADKFQGRDKEVVVLSLVRSNNENNVGELLQDWRRLNVSLTRARTKLVMVGSLSTISQGNELLGTFCQMVKGNGWSRDLKPGILDEHVFTDFATQVSEAPPKAAGSSIGNTQGMKIPAKVGLVDPRRLVRNRPVLNDIINDITI